MNYLLRVIIAVLGAIFTILGLVGTFGFAVDWLSNKKNSQWMFSAGIILVLVFLVASLIDIKQQEKEEMKSSYEGMLTSDSTSLFTTNLSAFHYLEIGDSGVAINYSGLNGQPCFWILDTPLTISENNGQIDVSAKIRGKNGLIAEIQNNEWYVNPSQSWSRNYNMNTLEVKNEEGDVVLQVRLLGDRIQFQGIFCDKNGKKVALVGRKDWGGCKIEVTGPNHPKLESSIEPIFGLHFGEVKRSLEVSAALSIYNFSGSVFVNPNPSHDINSIKNGGGTIIITNRYTWNPEKPERIK